jgi:hypothetical protein
MGEKNKKNTTESVFVFKTAHQGRLKKLRTPPRTPAPARQERGTPPCLGGEEEEEEKEEEEEEEAEEEEEEGGGSESESSSSISLVRC